MVSDLGVFLYLYMCIKEHVIHKSSEKLSTFGQKCEMF